MKKQIIYLIGLIFLILLVWGATYIGLQQCENRTEQTRSSLCFDFKIDY